jgi:DNA-damage-inducible protein J
MADDATIEVHVDAKIRDRASEVFAQAGMTIDDAVRNMLTHVATGGMVPLEAQAEDPEYDAWFRARVQEALDDPRPGIPSEEVEAYFAKRRAELMAKIEKS